ncbi:MAG TPA: peptidylprolyl isomerase [Solirubrobacteraceae bacterium]
MRRATVLSVFLLAAAALAACGKSGSPVAADTASTATSRTTTATEPEIVPRSHHDGCKAVPSPVPSAHPTVALSKRRLSRKRTYVAVLRTNCGTIEIELDVRHAPKTTASFAGLVRRRFYDGLNFHRVSHPEGKDFVIQGGDPELTGNGGPGYSVVERPSKKTRYLEGVVAMAKTPDEARGTSGSQFFIVTARDAKLPPDYAVLGHVVGSTTAVRRIARLTTDPVSEMPVDPVVIKSIRLTSRG